MSNPLSLNLRKLRLDKHMTQEQAAEQLGVSAQSVSRWETSATYPDVMLLPQIASLYGVLVDDLFRPAPRGYDNNALRLLAVYERSHKPEDFLAAAQEFEKLFRAGTATADDWRSYGVIHEYMLNHCIRKATASYAKAMDMSRSTDAELYHRIMRQSILFRSRIGQAEACVAEQDAALKASPHDPQCWVDLAHAQYIAGKHEAALHTCMNALARFPQEGLLHVYAGDACRAMKRYEDAFAHWEASTAISTEFLDAMYSMAFCHEELGQYAEAAAQFEAIVRQLEQRGLEIEAQWPREMAEKCRQNMTS
ncbi:MAG: helix-turn-helix domain-containing protein [Clostridia bacterium]|nr:helix-turn-helix domain-containing protein [Clostridia bacterium]